MKKIIFPFVFWGEAYSQDLSDYCLNTLIDEIKNIDENFYKIEIALWTTSLDLEIVKENFKNLSSRFNFININPFLIDKELSKLNKYQFLNIIQTLMMTKYKKKYDYIFFLYPDFVWSKGSIQNIIKKLNKFDIFFVYAPQIIKENYVKKYNKEKLKYADQKFIYENLHPIVTSNTINQNNSINTAACLSFKFKSYYIFRNFHLHPICVSLKNFTSELLKPFYISLDEDFVGNLNLVKKNIYIPRSSNQMIFASLCKSDEIKIPIIKNKSFYKIQNWVQLHAYSNHVLLSKNNFYLENKENGVHKKNKNDSNVVSKFMNKIYEKINLKSTDLFNLSNYILLIDRKGHQKKINFKIENLFYQFHLNKLQNKSTQAIKIESNIKKFLDKNIY